MSLSNSRASRSIIGYLKTNILYINITGVRQAYLDGADRSSRRHEFVKDSYTAIIHNG